MKTKWIWIKENNFDTYAQFKGVFSLNGKDESFKNSDEMLLDRNSYEVIRQRPLNYFLYHRDIEWQHLYER